VQVFGVIAAAAGIEHGVGELRQGAIPPPALVFQSWPDTPAFEVLAGEPALTLLPDLRLAGVATILVSLALAAWAVAYTRTPRAALGLAGIALVLLVVGGGFGPPLVGAITGFVAALPAAREGGAATRLLARASGWALAVAASSYLALVPGVPLLHEFAGFENDMLTYGLMALAFGGLALALAAARARDAVTARAGGANQS
jgi:hypothetical protein